MSQVDQPPGGSTSPSPAAEVPVAPTAGRTTTTVTGAPAAGPTAPSRRAGAGPRAGGPSAKAQRRHARVVVRKLGPWSVFKVSVIFYLCVMLVLIGAGVILYGMLGAIGALDSTQRLIRDLFADQSFVINGGWLFSRSLAIGLVMVVAWSLINVFVVFLYNLISDLVGGIEVTLAERR